MWSASLWRHFPDRRESKRDGGYLGNPVFDTFGDTFPIEGNRNMETTNFLIFGSYTFGDTFPGQGNRNQFFVSVPDRLYRLWIRFPGARESKLRLNPHVKGDRHTLDTLSRSKRMETHWVFSRVVCGYCFGDTFPFKGNGNLELRLLFFVPLLSLDTLSRSKGMETCRPRSYR